MLCLHDIRLEYDDYVAQFDFILITKKCIFVLETKKLNKEYRMKISKEDCLKPYMVFTNEELNSLIENKPKNKEELFKVKGFGPKKVEKYGECILEIING